MKMKWFKLKRPKSLDEQFGGRTMTVYPTSQDAKARTNATKLTVQHICGNLTHQTMFQVNGNYLVSMLDAYSELNKEPLVDQETHEAFLSTVAEHIERAPSLIDRDPKKSIWAGEVGPTIEFDPNGRPHEVPRE